MKRDELRLLLILAINLIAVVPAHAHDPVVGSSLLSSASDATPAVSREPQPLEDGADRSPQLTYMFGRAELLDGLGDWHHRITTNSKLAQEFFDQGLRLAYAFNDVEAYRAFRRSAAEDPNCAMAYWGMALVCGPNINRGMSAKFRQLALGALERAVQLAPFVSPPEREYIDALKARYSSRVGQDICDLRYSASMHALTAKYPDDLDAATLYAESLMDLSPGDYWYPAGLPRPHTTEVMAVLEGVLKRQPNHPGANHYYIHAVEASPHPELALPCADRIGSLMPGAGHMVHMAAHVYMRTGRYHDASEVNMRAIEVDHRYLAATNAAGEYAMVYCPHNRRFLWASLAMEGRSREAIAAAREVTASGTTNSDRGAAERQVPTLYLGLARFGRWNDLLHEPAPPAYLEYSTAIWHYAQGLAFANSGSIEESQRELRLLEVGIGRLPVRKLIGVNRATALLEIASETLAATIDLKQDQTAAAIHRLYHAVALQNALKYDEPPAWYYPVRETLVSTLLSSGAAREAEIESRADLKENPDSPWSLNGLGKALAAQGRASESIAVDKRFRTAWRYADIEPPAAAVNGASLSRKDF